MVAQAQAPPPPDLGGFLYSQIGEEENGTPLTILSAFARLGLDPWREAARLAQLPKEDAIRELASLIACLPRPASQPRALPKPSDPPDREPSRDGTSDGITRLISERLAGALGQPVSTEAHARAAQLVGQADSD